MRAVFVAAVCALCAAVADGAAVYGTSIATSPYLGVGGPLLNVAMMPKDTTAGVITIVSNSAFEVTNFTYTGGAPSTYWVTAASASPSDLEKYKKLNPDRLATNFTSTDLIVPVSSNVSWADTPIIALYCTEYKALFGSVDLKMAAAMKGSAVAPSKAMSTGGRKLL